MARYLQLAKYTPQACAAVFDGGVLAGKVLEEYVKGLGGTLLDGTAIADDEWDFVATIESDDFNAAKISAHLLTSTTGTIERSVLLSLAALEDVDAARSSLPGYTPPGR